jgi:hypothetical protein
MIPATVDRVRVNTDEAVNEEIRRRTEKSVECVAAGGPAAIERRLVELDFEWDIERYVETMAPTFTLLGLTLGLTRNRLWLILPFMVQGFFLQHALQGWCPPIPLLRRLGVRTCDEIEEERFALKTLRGDFRNVAKGQPVDAANAARSVKAARR